MLKRFNLENVRNCRDLGGFDLKNNYRTKWGRYIRSGNISHATDNDISKLLNYGVKHVIDLRTKSDLADCPTVWTEIKEVSWHNINLYGAERSSSASSAVLPGEGSEGTNKETSEKLLGLYDRYIHNYAGVRDVFNLFLTYPDDCFLFHCGIGKDRTGMIAFLLLGLEGTDLADIAADYSCSKVYLRTDIDTASEFGFPAAVLNSETENILLVYNSFRREFGGFDNYFRELGFSTQELNILKKSFLEEES